jgi:hypothetical protein
VQSQCWNKEEKDNYYPDVRKKVQGESAQFRFVHFKPFHEPRGIGVPQSQRDNPIEDSEKDANHKRAQEKVPKENNLFAFHDSSATSDEATGVRLFFHPTRG